MTPKTQTPEYLKREEVSDLLNVSLRNLNDILKQNRIPRIKLGKRTFRYRRRDLEEALDCLREIAGAESSSSI